MQAYDIEMLTRPADRAGDHGWCFGLPPGISPQQWPLDPANGYPLMHGFTLLLREDYRVHSPEIVALSFFATAPDHNDGGPCCVDGIADMDLTFNRTFNRALQWSARGLPERRQGSA